MKALVNDRWRGRFNVTKLGRHAYTIEGWVDHYRTWSTRLAKRIAAGQDVKLEIEIGARLIDEAAARAGGPDTAKLTALAAAIRKQATAAQTPRRRKSSTPDGPARRPLAQHRVPRASWRSWSSRSARGSAPGTRCSRARPARPACTARSATSRTGCPTSRAWASTSSTCRRSTRSARRTAKGRNNSLTRRAGRPRQPVGDRRRGGRPQGDQPAARHARRLRPPRQRAGEHGLEIALDIAFQCSPDHPYVREHPEWFQHRPDGTIQYAENPPKKYQDIYPFDFETRGLARAVGRAAVESSCSGSTQGVKIFRVDNPHTKPFPFWEWLHRRGQGASTPTSIFLAEAFTRPKVMYRWPRSASSQSYTYFTWRNTTWELTQYLDRADPAAGRRVLPAEPLAEHAGHPPRVPAARRPPRVRGALPAGRDARRQLRHLRSGLRAVREPRPRGRAPRSTSTPRSTSCAAGTSTARRACASSSRSSTRSAARTRRCSSDRGAAVPPDRQRPARRYTKATEDLSDVVLTVVNLDPHHTQRGMVTLPLDALGIEQRPKLPGARPAERRALPVARAAQLRRAQPDARCRRTSSGSAAACAASTTSSTSCDPAARAADKTRCRPAIARQ